MLYLSKRSQELFARAQNSLPGGVNSPVRAFKGVGGCPVFMERAEGAYLYDVEGKRYIDLIASWGPMILGHAHPQVVRALQEQTEKGTSFGTPAELEIQVAELMQSMAPNIGLIRMVNSGTEACMSAIRLARGYTRRDKMIKFEGHYHGHADSFLVSAGSGLATLNIRKASGLTEGVRQNTLIAEYNNLESVAALIRRHPEEIACIILEPVAGNMGCVVPQKGFLEGLRKLCDAHSILLIFDEVMTGFRLAAGGAQAYFGVAADLMTYGKIIGGGLPVGAFGGKKEIMAQIAPLGPVYQAGTLSGNPLAMRAGYETLSLLKEQPDLITQLNRTTQKLHQGLEEVFQNGAVPVCIQSAGSMISVFFTSEKVIDFTTAQTTDTGIFKAFFHHMLHRGIYLPPSAFESWFLNVALTEADINHIIAAARDFVSACRDNPGAG